MKRSIRQKGVKIYDFASCADIEDLFLLDFGGVCKFLGLPSATKMPSGNKGKSKIKKLFRLAGSYYHPGERAEDLIKALDMRTVVQKSSLPFQKLENIIKQIA